MHMNRMSTNGSSSHETRVAQRPRPTSMGPNQAVNIDFVKMAWDAKFLLLLGTLIGLGLGYFHFVQSPAIFSSSAQVQIIESSTRNLPVDGLETGLKGRNFTDEAMVMKSEQILARAATLGELSSTPEFAGMAPAQIAASLRGGLVVAPADDTGRSSIMSIQYQTTSASTSQRVVQAVVDAYGSHLKDQYRNVGQETVDLIQQARNEVLIKLKSLEDEFGAFKMKSGLIFRGNDITNLHRDHADRYMSQRLELMIRKASLQGTLTSAKQAISNGRPYESILIALNKANSVGGSRNDARQGLSLESKWELEKIRNRPLLSTSEKMRQSQLLPLEIERDVLIESVGPDHPAVGTIDRRIAILEQTIRDVAKSEEELNAEVDKAMIAANEEIAGSIPEATTPNERLKIQIQFAVSALMQQMEAIDAELNVLNDAYTDEMEQARSESDGSIESEQYVREIGRQQQLYDRIVARLDEVNLMSDGDGLKLFPLNTAKLGYQVAPSMAKSLLAGGFLGAMLAAGLALLRVLSDRSYHSARDVAEHTRLPVIGHVPVLKSKKIAEGEPGHLLDPRLVTYFQSKGQKAESFRAIRTALYFSNQSGENQILQITSATPSDGKSTIAANLAVSIAQSGRSVLLVDCDLRRPRVSSVMGVEGTQGTAWAISQCSSRGSDPDMIVQEAIQESEIENLSVMVSGDRPDNPSELLSSPGFEVMLASLRKKFDLIILDTPPLLAVSDPANVAARVDGVLLVVRLRKNIKPAVAQASRMLETLQANVIGVVVNGVGSRAARGYGRESKNEGRYNYGTAYQYGYGYSYGYADGKYGQYYSDDRPTETKKAKAKAAVEN